MVSQRDIFVELRGETEGRALVVLVGSPGHPERSHASEEVVVESGDEGTLFSLVGQVDREGVCWVVVVG